MKVKLENVWKEGSIKTKLANLGWIVPDKTFVKHNGDWSLVHGIEVVKLNQISDILTNTSSWIYDTNRGWYRNTYDWGTPHNSKFTADFLSKLRKVSAVFTGYYDNPAGSMANNSLAIHLSNGTIVSLAVSDSWDYRPSGQTIYKGDAGVETMVTRDVINERYTYTVPEGLTVTKIVLQSAGWYESSNGQYYPFSLRGMKDFEFTLRH